MRQVIIVWLLATGCSCSDDVYWETGPWPGSESRCWTGRTHPIRYGHNQYVVYDKYAGYGMAFFQMNILIPPDNQREFITTALKECRNDFGKAYRSGQLTYWHPVTNETPFPIQYVVVILQTPCAESGLDGHNTSHTVGYLLPAAEVFAETVDFKELLDQAYVHHNPVYHEPVSEDEKKHGYSPQEKEHIIIIEDHMKLLADRQAP